MKRKIKKRLGLLGSVLFAGYMAFASPVFAYDSVEEKTKSKKIVAVDHKEKRPTNSGATFTEDRISLQTILGYLSAPCGIGSDTPDLDYTQTNIRLGWMVNNPTELRFLPRGSLEAILELSNSAIHREFGNYISGATALLRYSIIQQDLKLIPYIQAGAGIVHTDAYKDKSQRAIGQAIEFTPQASLGLHYMIGKNLSIDSEIMFHHISNAGLAERNDGTNAIGGFVGLTFFFDKLWK